MSVIRTEGAFLRRSLMQLEGLYLRLRGSGLREALPEEWDIDASDHLKAVLREFRRLEQELDWELTGEIIRLKDLAAERAAHYARLRYGLSVGLPLTLPTKHPELPEVMQIRSVAFTDETPFEVLLEGVPIRGDGSEMSVEVQVLVGPTGVRFRIAGSEKRDLLRSQS